MAKYLEVAKLQVVVGFFHLEVSVNQQGGRKPLAGPELVAAALEQAQGVFDGGFVEQLRAVQVRAEGRRTGRLGLAVAATPGGGKTTLRICKKNIGDM